MRTDRDPGTAYRMATRNCPLDGEGCPTPDELAAAARGLLESARREEVVAILGNCMRCATLLQIAGDLESPPAMLRQSVPRRIPRWLGPAMAALVVVAIVPAWWKPSRDGVTRGGADAVQPASGAELTAAPARLTWATSAAVACRVTLRTDTADVVLHSGSISSGELILDAATRARMEAGLYLWTVDCGGQRLGPYSFTVRP